jgi:hypothetical protein
MSAGKLNLRIDQGASFFQKLVWKDSRGRVVNLAGYTARLQVRDRVGGEVLCELSTDNGAIVMGASTGTITLYLADEQTQAFTWSSGVYDLLLEAPDGDKRRLIEGKVTVSAGVTV